MRVLSTGGGAGEASPKKSFAEKKFTAINTIFSKFSGGACPRTPLEGLQNFFLAAEWLKNFFQARLPPPPNNNLTIVGRKLLDKRLLSVILPSIFALSLNTLVSSNFTIASRSL